MRLKNSIVLILWLGVLQISVSQTNGLNNSSDIIRCASKVPDAKWDSGFNDLVKQFELLKANGQAKAAGYTIPVIVHVIHGGQNVGNFPNISQAQVNSQIPVLNNDFAGTGQNVGNVPSAFSSLVANTTVSFCLAQLDPNGNCLVEAGIDRVDWRTIPGATNPGGANSSSAVMSLFDNFIKPATIWDPRYYFNIWVSDVGSNAQVLGYASFPANSTLAGLPGTGGPNNDGIWVWCRAFGTSGSIQAPYHRGRTATHEVGHWLGLRHVTGDNNCGNDFCNDTPDQQSLNFGCPSFPQVSCSNGPNGNMFMNFMDYCDDLCLYMFTPDQTTRMQTALNFGTYRSQLTASSASLCNSAPAPPSALFSLSSNSVCIDSVIVVSNLSTGAPCPTYSWVVTPSAGVTFTPNNFIYGNPKIKFTSPGYYTLSLTATNTSGTNSTIDVVQVVDCFNVEGLAELRQFDNGVSLKPNPGNGIFNLNVRKTYSAVVAISVYNAVGSLVATMKYTPGNSENHELDISDKGPGVYYVVVESGDYRATRKLIVLK